jgi:hypothetical protein
MHYNVIEYKSFYESPHRIAELEEASGRLLRIFEAEGQLVAGFEWGNLALPLETREELEPLVGHEVAVLRLAGKIHIRGVVEGA